MVTNYTPDISEYVAFTWYQWYWYFDEDRRNKSLCRWIGPANNIGQAMCLFVIIENGEYLARSSVIEVDKLAMQTPELQSQMEKFTSNLQSKIGNDKIPIFDPGKPDEIYYKPFRENVLEEEVALTYGDELVDIIDEPYMEDFDNLIGSQVNLPDKSGIPLLITAKKRKRDSQGHPVGRANDDPILDSSILMGEWRNTR